MQIRNKYQWHGSNWNSNPIVCDLVCGELWFDFNSYDSYSVIHRLSLFNKTKWSQSFWRKDFHIQPSQSVFDENFIVINSKFVYYFSKIDPGGHTTYGRSSYVVPDRYYIVPLRVATGWKGGVRLERRFLRTGSRSPRAILVKRDWGEMDESWPRSSKRHFIRKLPFQPFHSLSFIKVR